MSDHATYRRAVARLQEQYAALPSDVPVRLAKRSSNLFRDRSPAGRAGPALLDVSAFTGVLHVDPRARTADVLGMTTYDDLVDTTLAHGLMPRVVPQLRTITLGGAVSGLGIESTSFRNGLPHESVLDMDILTGDGQVLTVDPHGEHRALFYGFPNSYGSLGYALRLRIELEPVAPYVRLTHLRFADLTVLAETMAALVDAPTWGGEPVDFLDGMVVSPEEAYLTLGSFEQQAPYVSDYTGMQVYWRSITERREDHLTVHDYLWRWDTDWFWCSRAFGAQDPRLRRWWPKRWLRSDIYWKLVRLDRRLGTSAAVDRARGRPPRERVVQDVEVPVEHTAEFLSWFDREVGMRPVWLCPLRQRDPEVTWDLYAFDPHQIYVNIGFWGTVPLAAGQPDGHHNRLVEREVARLAGRKSLYSTAYYTEAEFRSLYGGTAYDLLKKTYDGGGRLLDLYTKCVGRG